MIILISLLKQNKSRLKLKIMQMKNSREFTQMEGKKEEELNKTF